ncbi:hypothetical protein [uncultured Polaribacter sp.]|uniref:DUF3575 domain-containing protein n=1 Tax=uncultured Polaribacter sp. TaxID=174711 RepID=UPI00260FB73A|nr:hypothetical protein [uncultured Polaribacter sp.]
MKKLILAFVLMLGSISYAQHEIKVDIADAIIIKNLDFSYERYLSESSSFGISLAFNIADQEDSFRYNENMMITPYFRNYFSTGEKWNFFGEAFIGVNSGKKETIEDSNDFNISYTDAALGVVVGTKFVSSGGFTIDLFGGIGRNMFSSDSPTLVPRLGLNIGWRL